MNDLQVSKNTSAKIRNDKQLQLSAQTGRILTWTSQWIQSQLLPPRFSTARMSISSILSFKPLIVNHFD